MAFVATNGVELHVERHGERGEPLVLVHGLTGDVSDWRHQVAAFAPTHRVLALDNRGHGRSEAPADEGAYAIERMAEDVAAVAAHAGFDRFHLVGHSMGGAIAQEIALASPERLLSLTLEDTSTWFGDHELRMPERPPPLPPERLAEVADRLARMSPVALRASWRALRRWPGTEARAGRIAARTLVVHGEHDAPAIVSGSRRLAEIVPGARLACIPGAGHCPQEECPEAFNALLREVLGVTLERPARPARGLAARTPRW